MLHITVPKHEFYDEATQEFLETDEVELTLEHSLISISKWEAKWKKAYFSSKKDSKTKEEILDYIRCMVIFPRDVDSKVLRALTEKNYEDIVAYIEDPMTATVINDRSPQPTNQNKVMTSEMIYYYMIAQNIPMEFEKWHINRLLTLIRVCAIKNDPHPKKMSSAAIAKQNRALNAARRKQLHTKG